MRTAAVWRTIGDLDGDGITDVAVGLGGLIGIHGKVWIQFLKADGTVRDIQEITEGVGGFSGNLDTFDRFGRNIANLGDLDGDGVIDIAVSAHGDDSGGNAAGAPSTSCFSTRTARSSRTRRSAKRTEVSRSTSTRMTSSVMDWHASVTWTATEPRTWSQQLPTTTTEAPTAEPSTCSSSTRTGR